MLETESNKYLDYDRFKYKMSKTINYFCIFTHNNTKPVVKIFIDFAKYRNFIHKIKYLLIFFYCLFIFSTMLMFYYLSKHF